jgi:hypothetical protein
MERKGENLIVSFVFLPSFSGPHALYHQGQRPKTVEATIHSNTLSVQEVEM